MIEVDEADLREVPADDGEPAQFRIAYEDDSLLVVDKPAGVVVHPARGHSSGTLVQALAGQAGEVTTRSGPASSTGSIATRRDCWSSPAMKRPTALRAAMSKREIKREYLALVNGRPSSRSGTIDAAIGRDRRNRTKVSLATDRPRSAVTHFEIEQTLPESTLLRVTLETGRTHQIRAHLGAIGLPVVGDQSYGDGADYGLTRQFLHATRLRFSHPLSGAEVDVVSPLPADLERALNLAQGAL